MQFKQMFVTVVCVLFLLKLKWPKSKNFYETNIYAKRMRSLLSVSATTYQVRDAFHTIALFLVVEP